METIDTKWKIAGGGVIIILSFLCTLTHTTPTIAVVKLGTKLQHIGYKIKYYFKGLICFYTVLLGVFRFTLL